MPGESPIIMHAPSIKGIRGKVVRPINFSGYEEEQRLGYVVLQNQRTTQEDSLCFWPLKPELLQYQGRSLKTKELNFRFWTAIHNMDQDLKSQVEIRTSEKEKGLKKLTGLKKKIGSTLAAVLYDGQGGIIHSYLGDSPAFIVFYEKNTGELLGLERLNTQSHKSNCLQEQERIAALGGFISQEEGRVGGFLTVTRALGDFYLKDGQERNAKGLCADAKIEAIDTHTLANRHNIKPERFGIFPEEQVKVQIILCSDGLTDAAKERMIESEKNPGIMISSQSKEGHELYLQGLLKAIKSPGKRNPEKLANDLATAARRAGSQDNTSILILQLELNEPSISCVFDGHGGADVSTFLAQNFVPEFIRQCSLSPEEYAKQEFSVYNHRSTYECDNGPIDLSTALAPPLDSLANTSDLITSSLSIELPSLPCTDKTPCSELIPPLQAKPKPSAQTPPLPTALRQRPKAKTLFFATDLQDTCQSASSQSSSTASSNLPMASLPPSHQDLVKIILKGTPLSSKEETEDIFIEFKEQAKTASLELLDLRDGFGRSLLIHAATTFNLKIIEYLLDCGVNTNLRSTRSGSTALHALIIKLPNQLIITKACKDFLDGCLPIILRLIETTDLNLTDINGKTSKNLLTEMISLNETNSNKNIAHFFSALRKKVHEKESSRHKRPHLDEENLTEQNTPQTNHIARPPLKRGKMSQHPLFANPKQEGPETQSLPLRDPCLSPSTF